MRHHTSIKALATQARASTWIGLAVVLALLASTSASLADRNTNPQVLPPQARAFGKTYGEWAAAWWQWALSIPAAENPVTDGTGEFCHVGQSGPVWFLAGNFGGATVRDCTVPAGRALFIPINNVAWIGFPGDPTDEDFIRDLLAFFVDHATDLACEIDDRPIQNIKENYRVKSPIFEVELPDGNLYGAPAGVYAPCIDDGYYLMHAPLPVGEHTIHIHSLIPDFGGPAIDVTYNLTVR